MKKETDDKRLKVINRFHIPFDAPLQEVIDAIIEYLDLEIYIYDGIVKARKKLR